MIRLCLVLFYLVITSCSAPSTSVKDEIANPLTVKIASIERGAKLFAERGNAHCVLCHRHDKITREFQGNLGPDLSGLSERLTPGQIRLRIVDYDAVKPGTTMPSYYRTENLNAVDPDFLDKTVLTALEIEDIIAFLVNNDDEFKP